MLLYQIILFFRSCKYLFIACSIYRRSGVMVMNENLGTSYSKNNLQAPFYNPFLMHMEQSVSADEEAKALIPGHCKLVTFPKGYRLLNMGRVCKYVYFIVTGECISYYTDSHGKTTTWFFHFNQPQSNVKNLFAVDYKSFLSEKPSTISIEALSPITAIRFSIKDVQALTTGSGAIERWLRLLNERAYMQTQDRITSLLTLSAPERYKRFLATEPHLLNMFSNYLVATYLNVAPQSLSRIRRKIATGML